MSTIITRTSKASPLTFAEVDANFNNLNSDKTENDSAAITGGTINGVTIGATTPSTGSFTTILASGNITDSFITLANGTLALAFASKGVVKVSPTATGSFTTTVPPAGTRCTLIVLTTGVTSFTMTFSTGFKIVGTLATGTVAARHFIFEFISDGTSLIESSRTVAIV